MSTRFVNDTRVYNIEQIIEEVDKGRIRLPQYQRAFVWDAQAVCNLWDSMIKNISLGSITLWETTNRLGGEKSISGVQLPYVDKNVELKYALDGQQRLTSIYAMKKGLVIKNIDFSEFYIDITKDPTDYFSDIAVHYHRNIDTKDAKYVKVVDILNAENKHFHKLPPNCLEYSTIFREFKLSAIVTKGNNKNVAKELFVRTNNTGKPLTTFNILSAAVYSEEDNFYFQDKVNNLMDKYSVKGLDKTKEPSVNDVLKLLTTIFIEDFNTNKVLTIDVESLINDWKQVDDALGRAFDFLYDNLNINNIDNLHNSVTLSLLTKYFYKYKGNVTSKQKNLLIQFFWYINMSSYLTSHFKGKIPKAIRWLDDIHLEDTPNYDYEILYTKEEFIMDSYFENQNTGQISAVNKKIRTTMLTYLQSLKPLSFSTGMEVNFQNYSTRNKSNLHHIFPKSLYKDGNQIGNMSILDALTNQNISNKHPGDYFQNYIHTNEKNNAILESHCINFEMYGYLMKNDFTSFTNARITKIYNDLISLSKGKAVK